MRKGIIYVYFNRAKYEKEGIEKYYVGQTVRTAKKRAGKDGSGYGALDENCNNKFARGIRKWGWDAFECRVLEEVYEEDLDELEKFYIEQFDSYENGYNMTRGGEGATGRNPFANKTEEERKEIFSKIGKKVAIKNRGQKRTLEQKQRMSIAQKGKKMPEEAKKKLRDINLGEKNPNYGLKRSFETRKKISESKKGENNPMYGKKSLKAKKIYCPELNILFYSINEAKKFVKDKLGASGSNITSVCAGNRNYACKLKDGTKLTWKYKEDVDQETLKNAIYIDKM